MKREHDLKYAKRIFQIYIHTITFKNHFKFNSYSSKTVSSYNSSADVNVKISKCFELTSIDTINRNERIADNIINLDLYSNDTFVSTVSFDVSKEKITKDDAKSLFRRAFSDKSGSLDYKFISVRTEMVSNEEIGKFQEKRNTIMLRRSENYQTLKRQNQSLQQIKVEKDKMINSLEQKVGSLIGQNIELNKKISEQMQKLKNPLNINVNINTKAQRVARAYSSQSKYLPHKVLQQINSLTSQNKNLKDQLIHFEVDNKKLAQNAHFLLEQLKKIHDNRQDSRSWMKAIERRVTDMNSEYLITKAMNHYDQKLNKSFVGDQIDDNIKEIHKLLRVSSEGEMKNSRDNNNFLKVNNDNSRVFINKQPFKEQQIKMNILLSPSKVFSPEERLNIMYENKKESDVINKRLTKQSMISRTSQIHDGEKIAALLARKQKQLQILQGELKKKQSLIDRLLARQNQYEKQYQQMQKQKANLLSSMAISSLGNGKVSNDQYAGIKQLTNYNAQLLKEKQKIIGEMKALKDENAELTKKLNNFEIASRKSLIFMEHITKQKTFLQEKFKESIKKDNTQSIQRLAEKEMDYQNLKGQFIECSQELATTKALLKEVQEKKAQLDKEISQMSVQIQRQALERKRLTIQVDQIQDYQKQIKLYQDKYDDLQKMQKGIKTFIMKLQSHMATLVRKKDDEIYQQQMKTLLKEAYMSINTFEDEFYQVQIEAIHIAAETIRKYYDSIGGYHELQSKDKEKQQQVWKNRYQLIKERQSLVRKLKQKEDLYISKKADKFLFIEDEYQRFLDGLKKVNERITQLQSYKLYLREIVGDTSFAPFLFGQRASFQKNSLQKSGTLQSPPNIEQLKPMDPLHKSSSVKPPKNSIVEQQWQGSSDSGEHKSTKNMGQYSIIINNDSLDARKSQISNLISKDRQVYNSKMSRFFEDNQKIRESLAHQTNLKQQLSRERIENRKKEAQMIKNHNIRIANLEKEFNVEKRQKSVLQFKLKELESTLKQSQNRMKVKTEVEIKGMEEKIQEYYTSLKTKDSQISSIQQLLNKAGDELIYLCKQLQRCEEQNENLEQQRQQLMKQLQSYQLAEKILIQQVKTIKIQSQQNQSEIQQLLEQRSDQFIKIQKIKSTQIEKLKACIQQIEERLEEEVNEGMKQRQKNQELEQYISLLKTQSSAKNQQIQIMMENMERQVQHERELKEGLEDQNKLYYKHILQLSEQIQAHEKQIIRLSLMIESSNKQKRIFSQMGEKLARRQQQLAEQRANMQRINAEKSNQFNKWQLDYRKIEQEMSFLVKQEQKMTNQLEKSKQERQQSKSLLFTREKQILQLQKQKSILQINLAQLNSQISALNDLNKMQQAKIRELIETIQLSPDIRISDKGGKITRQLQKSRRELGISKKSSKDGKQSQDSDFMTDRSNAIMKISSRSNIVSKQSQKSSTQSAKNNSPKSNFRLDIPVMKTNRILNLISVESEMPNTQQDRNLRIIEQRHEQLYDSYINDKRPQQSNRDYQIVINRQHQKSQQSSSQNSSPLQFKQSRVNIQMPYLELQHQQQGHHGYQEDQRYQNLQQEMMENNPIVQQLMQQIKRLKEEIDQLKSQKGADISKVMKKKDNLTHTIRSDRSILSNQNKQDSSNQFLKPENGFKILRLGSKQSHQTQSIKNTQNNMDEIIKELEQENNIYCQKIKELNEKKSSDELYIAEKENEIIEKQKAIETLQKNLSNLMEQVRIVSQSNCELQSQLVQYEKAYNSLYQKSLELKNELQSRIEDLASECLVKDKRCFQIQGQKGRLLQLLQQSSAKLSLYQDKISNLSQKNQQSSNTIKQLKLQYRKYQQQSETQILRLQQDKDRISLSIKEKQQQLQQLAVSYIQLQQTNRSLLMDLKAQQDEYEKAQKKNYQLAQKIQNGKGEIDGNQKYRKNMMQKVKQLELQNIRLSEKLSDINKNYNVEAQKLNIRLSSEKQASNSYQQRIKQKQNIIIQLKNQIAAYNQECDELKSINESLNCSVLKAQKQLKEIMAQYEQQFRSLQHHSNNKIQSQRQLQAQIRSYQKQLQLNRKQERKARDDIKMLEDEKDMLLRKNKQLTQQISSQTANLFNQLQHKKNQNMELISKIEKIQKINEQLSTQMQKIIKSSSKEMETLRLRSEQQRMTIQKLQQKLSYLEKRPTSDKLKQKQYLISLLENKNKQLQSLKTTKQPQKNGLSKKHQAELLKLSSILTEEKGKNHLLQNELQTVVKAYKRLQQFLSRLKQQHNNDKRSQNTLALQLKHAQRRIDELQRQNEQLQKDYSLTRISRLDSFSKIIADTPFK